jgi:hypothetical protein
LPSPAHTNTSLHFQEWLGKACTRWPWLRLPTSFETQLR